MAYTRTQWVEQETPLSAQNMNNIEDGIEELQSTKVDKATGKGLSDQNYTAAEKTKLAGIETGAQVNPGVATTSANGLMSAADKSKLDGVQAGAQVNRTYTPVSGNPTSDLYPGFGTSILVSQVSQDANGQVSLTNRPIKIPDKIANQNEKGLMSPTDVVKLDQLEIKHVVVTTSKTYSINPKSSEQITYNIPYDGYSIAILEGAILPDGLCIGKVITSSEDGSVYAIKVTVTNAAGTVKNVTTGSRANVLLIKGDVLG